MPGLLVFESDFEETSESKDSNCTESARFTCCRVQIAPFSSFLCSTVTSVSGWKEEASINLLQQIKLYRLGRFPCLLAVPTFSSCERDLRKRSTNKVIYNLCAFADMIFVKTFTLADFAKFKNIPLESAYFSTFLNQNIDILLFLFTELEFYTNLQLGEILN